VTTKERTEAERKLAQVDAELKTLRDESDADDMIARIELNKLEERRAQLSRLFAEPGSQNERKWTDTITAIQKTGAAMVRDRWVAILQRQQAKQARESEIADGIAQLAALEEQRVAGGFDPPQDPH